MSELAIDFDAVTNDYIDAKHNCNLLLMTAYSKAGYVNGPYYTYSRYAHGYYIATHETGLVSDNLWGTAKFYSPMQVYNTTNLDKVFFFKLPAKVEISNASLGLGYQRTVYPAFTGDETLLIRAEARILQGKYDEAASDMTVWMQNIINTDVTLTPQMIQKHFSTMPYAYDGEFSNGTDSQIKKHLHPSFSFGEEGSVQESMLQAVLSFRRIETLQTGLRWFDVRRYGIVIPRRLIGPDASPSECYDWLKKDDPRRTLQIPTEIVQAGFPETDR